MPRFGGRLVAAAFACSAVSVGGQYGIASASPTFDADGYSACTAAAAPGPQEIVDGVATSCCVQFAGIPTGTRFGMGCVAPVVNSSEDFRPTIILPTRPVPPEENQTALDALVELPIAPPFEEPGPLG